MVLVILEYKGLGLILIEELRYLPCIFVGHGMISIVRFNIDSHYNNNIISNIYL